MTDVEEQLSGSRWTNDLSQSSFDPCQGLIKHLPYGWLCIVLRDWSQGIDIHFSHLTLPYLSHSERVSVFENILGKAWKERKYAVRKMVCSASAVWARWLVPINRNYLFGLCFIYLWVWRSYGESAGPSPAMLLPRDRRDSLLLGNFASEPNVSHLRFSPPNFGPKVSMLASKKPPLSVWRVWKAPAQGWDLNGVNRPLERSLCPSEGPGYLVTISNFNNLVKCLQSCGVKLCLVCQLNCLLLARMGREGTL